jgi:hypothetical protein
MYIESPPDAPPDAPPERIELFVRGTIPEALRGHVVVATNRRSKRRDAFARWQDSPADLLRITLEPGTPGRAIVDIWRVDPSGRDIGAAFEPNAFEREAMGTDPEYGYATQPNHGLNVAGGKVWTTNLLFGAPLEMDLARWRPTRLLRFLEPRPDAPRVTTTAHFAWSKDGRFAFLQQALLSRAGPGEVVRSVDQRLIRLDTRTGESRVWTLLPPDDDDLPEAANFHSAFYWEEGGRPHVGLLRTGAVIETLDPGAASSEALELSRSPPSTVWAIRVDEGADTLRAFTLPGVREIDGISLSHLDVDNSMDDGFVLYANYKQADVAEETHGTNIYGQPPELVAEHYAGMITEALNAGTLLRYERRGGTHRVDSRSIPYDAGRTSLGHTWLPINIVLDESREHLFCTFSGFRPRLLSRRLAEAYPDRRIEPEMIRDVPSLLMRFHAGTLTPAYEKGRRYLSYYESHAIDVVGSFEDGHVVTFSPEFGLRIFRASDLSQVIGHATGHEIWHVGDEFFRPTPAHLQFVPA